MTDAIKPSDDHQQLILAGLMKNSYIYSVAKHDLNDAYFNDSRCKIIYKAIESFYSTYEKLPNEIELLSSIDDNYIDLGVSKEDVQSLAKSLYNSDEITESYLLHKTAEFVKKIRARRVLNKNFEMIKNGTSITDEELLDEMIAALDVSYEKSGIFCLDDISSLDSVRRAAMGDGDKQPVIKSIFAGLNDTLQYKGFQRGTLNLIVSPPGCFTGDTKIMTLDGSSHSLEELYQSDDEIGIYGCSSEGEIVTGLADSIYLSDYVDELIEVELDNGFKIKCTYDHPFMMRDGSYKKAENLNNDDSLMPIHRGLSNINGKPNLYEYVTNGDGRGWFTHRLSAQLIDRPDGYTVIHHKVKSIRRMKLDHKVPVYGVVDAGKYHNYALDVGDGEGVFVSNTGKTSYLVNEGSYAAQQGFHVLHVFLGDMVNYDGFIRYMSNISGRPQNEIVSMTLEEQDALVIDINKTYGNVLKRLFLLSYGAGELTVDSLLEGVKKEQERQGVHFDMVIVDYADNFMKDNTNLYVEGGAIYDRLALFARVNQSVVMVASQPKQNFWNTEIIPLEGASESSKKQHIVDLLMTFNLVNRGTNIGTFFIPKVRRGISGRFIRVETHWEVCKIFEITEEEYTRKRDSLTGMM